MKTSYLVAAIGEKKAALVQCFAVTQERASKAVSALFLDHFGEVAVSAECIDTDAVAGLFIEAEPQYVKNVIAQANA